LVVGSRDFRSLIRDLPSLQLKVLDAVGERLPPE
jgi:hypothetical protein